MKRIMSLFVILLFVVGCGGGSRNTEINSPDFEEIEIPTEFTPEDLSSDSELDDAHLVPEEMIKMVKDSLTMESARTALVRRIRDAHPCGALDDLTDKQVWDQVVYEFNLDSRLHTSGNNLEESIRNLLAYDLSLDRVGTEDGNDFYGDTLEDEEVWSILAEELEECS